MKFFEKELCPGVRMHVIPKDTFKTDFLMVRFWLPLNKETVSRYALLPNVLGRGCETYPTLEALAERLDTLYDARISGRAVKCGETQMVSFLLRCLEQPCTPEGKDLFSELIDTFTDVLFHPLTEDGVFLPSYVESEKQNLIDAIRAKINNKTAYAMHRLEEEMCREEVYGIPGRGTVEDAAAVTPKNLYRAYLDMLACAPAEIYYVGKLDAQMVLRVLMPFFDHLTEYRRSPLYAPETAVIRHAAHPVRVVTEDMPAKQSKLCIGYRTDAVLSDGDFYKFALFNELLGGSASSKLFLEVRERRNLCYYCSSYPEAQKGILLIGCGIHAQKRDEAERAIYAQLDAIRNGDITDAEFAAAKKSLISGYREIEDSAAALAGWYCNRLAAGIETSPEETAAQVRSCTKEMMMDCAARVSLDTVYFMNGTQTDDEENDEEGMYDESI